MRGLAALTGLLLGLAAGPAEAAFFPRATSEPAARAALPDLKLVGGDGKPLPLSALKGRWTWLYLGYVSCPDACPMTLGFLADAYGRLPRPDDLSVLFVSVDPARDTPERLRQYAGFYHRAFRSATGDRPTLDALAAALGARYAVPADARPDGNYVVGHPNQIFVIDPAGRLAATYETKTEAVVPRLVADFASILPGAEAAGIPATNAAQAPPDTTAATAWCGFGDDGGLGGDALMARARALGSGTSVLPAASPMRMWGVRSGAWAWMLHGDAAAGLNAQGGDRGGTSRSGENWGMLHGSGFVGPGIVDLRAMGSLEALTTPAGGTPQLYQTGETWQFKPLVDRQHPHDAIMELAARYTWNLDPRTALFAYGGPAGEPALGPPSFMHRPSAADGRQTPLAHHQQDATHVAYGVATAGFRRDDWQVEGSVFNGRDPDEDRFDFDFGPMDSWAARVSWFPGRNWALQASHGWLEEPEILYAGDVMRTTASATHVGEWDWGTLSTTFAWGQNREYHRQLAVLQSYGLEGQADLKLGAHLYGRMELVDRLGMIWQDPLMHRVGALTLGGVWDLGPRDRYELGLGAEVTTYTQDLPLEASYGYNPVSARVFLRFRPPAMAVGR